MNRLPIEGVVDDLKEALKASPRVVLQAPPGAGKTTVLPLRLLDEAWLAGRKILLLEPRRLAARAAAHRLAATLKETVGRTVGYRVRMDRRIGPQTRIEVITEGILTRRLQSDPSLCDVGLVIFDEFHERSLDADLGLALCLDLAGVLNADLRLLVMSATLNTARLAALLGNAPVIACQGRSFPVQTEYLGRRAQVPLEAAMVDAILSAVRAEHGSILAFLPGAPEIRRVRRRLGKAGLGAQWVVVPLYGDLSGQQQDLAIAPPPEGKLKIVLASAIAETSLTIEGVGIVVDSGLQRIPRFDVASGMTRLATVPVSRASADQRQGRAGRTGPGLCLRLWSPDIHAGLVADNRPEILDNDLAQLALELALWGVQDPGRLAWLDPPPEAAFSRARELLSQLGALDPHGRVTEHGRRMAELPLHPRLAHMLLASQEIDQAAAACKLAALLSERDVIRFSEGRRDVDLGLRMDALREIGLGKGRQNLPHEVDQAAGRRILQVAAELKRHLRISSPQQTPPALGRLLAWAYPDRIAQRRPGPPGRYLLTGGRGAFLEATETLAGQPYLVAADLDGDPREARIHLAAAYDEATLLHQFAGQITSIEQIEWDKDRQAVRALQILKLGALSLRSEPVPHPDASRILKVLIQGIRQEGIDCLPWTRALRTWQARVEFIRRISNNDPLWPDVSDEGLCRRLEQWLSPCLYGISRLRDLASGELGRALFGQLTATQCKRLDELAPTHIVVPSGSRIAIDYSPPQPVLAVRLQEMFGATQGPAVAAGRHPLLLHLLSPAGRPLQVTRDLAGFWHNGYPGVKKELKGRYPKHFWPDDPLRAPPTARAKPKKASGR
jgi:ATP-dependent helicase HrpB